ncbi:hypothetical protein FA13DRAFT_1714966 [Coprinellus micaceus]|uniref:Uncharacterized protein n=1 Tax=Coprinellus micaceus TaxID=71717 RepID=A0A4Y7SQZ1_COPMI|nr:hypothetical protein FA13DRAFT_1714966 [Coprinellus micaceus]
MTMIHAHTREGILWGLRYSRNTASLGGHRDTSSESFPKYPPVLDSASIWFMITPCVDWNDWCHYLRHDHSGDAFRGINLRALVDPKGYTPHHHKLTIAFLLRLGTMPIASGDHECGTKEVEVVPHSDSDLTQSRVTLWHRQSALGTPPHLTLFSISVF